MKVNVNESNQILSECLSIPEIKEITKKTEIDLFDVLKLKSNLSKIGIHNKHYLLDFKRFNQILFNKHNLIEIELTDLIIDNSDENNINIQEFVKILTKLTNFKCLKITEVYKYYNKTNNIFSRHNLKCLLDFVVTKQLKYFELADLNNVVTQEDLSTILSIDYNQVPNIDKVKLNLFLTFSKINHYNFLDLSNLVELNIGPLDKISFYTLISYLKYTHITTLTIRLNKSNDFDHNDFKFLMEEKSILKVLEIYHIDFGDTNNYDRILEYLFFNNSIRHFVISSYYESFGISIQHEVIYNNN